MGLGDENPESMNNFKLLPPKSEHKLHLTKGAGFPDGSAVMQEMQVQSPARKGPLEEKVAAHSSVLSWRILWTEEPGGLQSIGLQRVGHDRSDLMYKGQQ